MLKCRDVGQLLLDYVDGALASEHQRDLEVHLADCPACLAFLRTYRETIRVSRDVRCEEIPAEVQRRLRDFIRRRLGESRA